MVGDHIYPEEPPKLTDTDVANTKEIDRRGR